MTGENLNIRFIPFFIFVFIAGVLVLLRLFQVQVLLHESYEQIADRQHINRIPLEIPRGKIYDRRGTVLGLTIPRSYSYGVHPRDVRNRQKVSAKLAEVSGKPASYFNRRMNSQSNFVWLLRQQDVKTVGLLSKVPDLIIKAEARRYYPLGNYTPKAVGFTGYDCEGVAGLELLYDSTLTSTGGWEIVLEDAYGNQAKNSSNPGIDPIPGSDLILTFDNVIQNLVSRELENAVELWNAKGGCAIVMLPRTGEILGMTSYPLCDPNYPDKAGPVIQRIINVVDTYEPGSTFKIVPMLAAIKRGISMDRVIDCEHGSLKIGKHWINDEHKFTKLTAAEVLIYSSNIGIGKIAALAGDRHVYEMSRDLGFGTYTGIEIPGEARGNIPPPGEWDEYLRATYGMGQGVSCSGIQLACAYGAVAADGILLQPRVIRNVMTPYGPDGDNSPLAIRRVAKKTETDALIEILIRAVEEGTGKAAKITGFTVAGKTGTAQKYDAELKKYSEDRYIASFIGFTVEEPRVLCYIAIDEPQGDYYGAKVAAPVFKNIMEKAVPVVLAGERDHFGPHRRFDKVNKNQIVLDDYMNAWTEYAESQLHDNELMVKVTGGGKVVINQFPFPGSYVIKGDTVELFTSDAEDDIGNLAGLTARRAAKRLIASGYSVNIRGCGLVREASFNGNKCTLICSPRRITEDSKLTACVLEK